MTPNRSFKVTGYLGYMSIISKPAPFSGKVTEERYYETIQYLSNDNNFDDLE